MLGKDSGTGTLLRASTVRSFQNLENETVTMLRCYVCNMYLERFYPVPSGDMGEGVQCSRRVETKVSFSETGEINCGKNKVGYSAAAGNNKLDVNKAT